MNLPGNAALHELPDPLARAIESSKVPALPQALLRLLQLAADDRTSMRELATIVEQDPGLCARMLSAANSPGLHYGTPLVSVTHCLTALGTRMVRSIATCLSLQAMFDRRYDAIRADLTQFWRHSIHTAEASRELAAACGYPRPEEAYLAGLLHDIGELVLLSALGGTYAQVLSAASDESVLSQLERERLGVHHGEVGAWLVDRWSFDLPIGDAILFHHASTDEIATAWTLPQIVWLAHDLCGAEKPAAGTRALAARLFGEAVAAALPQIAAGARERTEAIAEALGVDAEPTPPRGRVVGLPKVAVNPVPAGETDAEGEIEAAVREMALMQPLQRDLFGVESDAELLRSLRESARILFDLAHIAFFLRGPDDERLSAARFGEQPALFRHASIRTDATHCLVAAAAASRRILSTFDADYPQPPALIDVQFARVFDTEGLLCVPMSGRSGAIGVMVFGLSAGQHSRLQRRLPWVENFGRIAALSLEAWHDAIRFRRQAEENASAHFERQARRVVHEAGNPLGIIRSYLKILDGKLPEDAAIREELGVLREEIDRVSAIVRRLSEIPRGAPGAAGLDVATLVHDLLAFYDETLFRSRGITAVLSVGEGIEAVSCDRDSLKQILVNLWKNASEAMPGGGRVEVAVDGGIVHNGRRHVGITVADNGPGLPPQALAKLAEGDAAAPAGERGIGLSIVAALARQAGATLSCRSRPQAGTTFTLLLPCSA